MKSGVQSLEFYITGINHRIAFFDLFRELIEIRLVRIQAVGIVEMKDRSEILHVIEFLPHEGETHFLLPRKRRTFRPSKTALHRFQHIRRIDIRQVNTGIARKQSDVFNILLQTAVKRQTCDQRIVECPHCRGCSLPERGAAVILQQGGAGLPGIIKELSINVIDGPSRLNDSPKPQRKIPRI